MRASASSVRLFNRIAFVLHALDSLAALRARIDALSLSPEESVAALGRMIAGLLAVVFEAADAASDPEISRALVALFNFMQGKELAGQERATGVAGFALGACDTARQQRMTDLVEAQARCLELFAEFGEPDLILRWHHALPVPEAAEFERLRGFAGRVGASPGLSVEAGERWFELATMRIDAMREIEMRMTERLAALCTRRIADAEADLSRHRTTLDGLAALDDTDTTSMAVFFSAPAPSSEQASNECAGDSAATVLDEGMGATLGRSVLDLVQAQAQRIQRMSDELAAARAALNERKIIERGKGVLMAHRGLTEEQAYRLMRQTAMDQGRRLVDVAESVLALGAMLGGAERDKPAR